MNADPQFSICRPGHGASCALCCGSHNYLLTEEGLYAMYRQRAATLSPFSREYLIRTVRSSRNSMTGSYYAPSFLTAEGLPDPVDRGGTRCPFTGFVDDGHTIGCMIYPDAHTRGGRMDCAQSYRGKVFSCDARDTLSRSEIDYAARITGDWYYYGILIHHPALLKEIIAEGIEPEAVAADRLSSLRDILEKFRMSGTAVHRIDSYFGVQADDRPGSG